MVIGTGGDLGFGYGGLGAYLFFIGLIIYRKSSHFSHHSVFLAREAIKAPILLLPSSPTHFPYANN
jgi:hypothetical protein